MAQLCARLFVVLLLISSSIGMQAVVHKVAANGELATALDKASEGDIILVKGGTTYKVTSKENGFSVPAGVRLYGGFTEAQLNEATDDLTDEALAKLLAARPTGGEPWKLAQPTVLSGDIQGDDAIAAPVDLLSGSTRSDNAFHVLTVTGGSEAQPTVIDGFTISGGYAAKGAGSHKGGGIYATKGSLTVSNCFLYNNSAYEAGGAIYTEEGAHATLYNLLVFNNGAGDMLQTGSVTGSLVGGVYLGKGLMYNCVVANNMNGGIRMGTDAYVTGCTVARNTLFGISFASGMSEEQSGLTHTVLWGNTTPFAGTERPKIFNHCAFVGATGGHVAISDNNAQLGSSPFFTRPSEKTQYDINFKWTAASPYPMWDWSIGRTSELILEKNDVTFPADAFAQQTDMAGKQRFANTESKVMDVGAYQHPRAKVIVRVDNQKKDPNAKGDSWEQAMNDLQAAINYAASQGGGEVWVKGNGQDHPYRPTTLIYNDKLSTNYLAFIMKDGVSVYGGFDGTEGSLEERDNNQRANGKKFPKDKTTAIPWEFPNETVLQGAISVDDDAIFTLKGGAENGAAGANPTMSTKASSYHVVWFAPLPESGVEADAPMQGFTNPTVLDGVTIKHGNATSSTKGREQRGGGVYMVENTTLSNCVVTECMAADGGGAVYMDGGGQVRSCMIHRNGVTNDDASLVARGGGVYMRGQGMVMRSMLSNNLADEGGGVFLAPADGFTSDYLILTTNIITNNTARVNGGAVYMNKGGVIQQSTIAMNYCTAARTLMSGGVYNGETGGVYINEKGVVFNTVLWNNQGKANSRGLFALNPSTDKVKVWAATMAEKTLINWNGIDQKNIMALNRNNTSSDTDHGETGNEVYYPNFWESKDGTIKVPIVPGVYNVTNTSEGYAYNNYYWEVADGSSFNNKGMAQDEAPTEVVLNAQIDLAGDEYPIIPDLGAYVAQWADLHPKTFSVNGQDVTVLFVDPACTDATHDGRSWNNALYSLNNAIQALKAYRQTLEGKDATLEVWVKEGTLVPSAYVLNTDPRTATIEMEEGITLRGGFPATLNDDNQGGDCGWSLRNPALYHSVLDGNIGDENSLTDNLYHVVTFGEGVKDALLDGFHVINGYAGGQATLLQGGGVMAREGADVQLMNCILENNASAGTDNDGEGAAIYAATAANLTLTNTVVNNCGHASDADVHNNTPYIISVPTSGKTTVDFCTFVNNHVDKVFSGSAQVNSSLFVNSGDNTNQLTGSNNTINSFVTEDVLQASFENPTKNNDVSVGFNNYKGGYTSFRPIDMMDVNGLGIVNGGGSKTVDTDIAQNGRDLGGVPDRGAYEADLPEAGKVIYVRTTGKDNNDGRSWATAKATIREAMKAAQASYTNGVPAEENERVQIWVAAGTYTQSPAKDSDPACFIIEEGVNVYGAFPATGNPGMDERKPLDDKFASILEPLNVSTGTSRISSGDRSTAADLHNQSSYIRRVLAQQNKYNPKRFPKADVDDENNYYWLQGFKVMTEWDGFTIQNGRIDLVNCADDGGAGARLYKNVTLRNCILQNNYNTASGDRSGGKPDMRGGGVYSIGGTLINCHIRNNHLGSWDSGRNPGWENDYGAAYGGGIFCNFSTLYNCVISENSIHARYADGAGVGMEVGEFYNNTVVGNKVDGGSKRAVGGIRIWVGASNLNPGKAAIYNSIIYNNSGFHSEEGSGNKGYVFGNDDIGVAQGSVDLTNCILGSKVKNGASSNYQWKDADWDNSWGGTNGEIKRTNCIVQDNLDLFVPDSYHLKGTAGTVNSGENVIEKMERIKVPEPNNADSYEPGNGPNDMLTLTSSSYKADEVTINLFEYTDMDYKDRVIDCTVDAGAYEYQSDAANPDVTQGQTAVYYVTQNGEGTADGSTPQTAACATKLQTILNAAGEYKALHNEKQVIVKVAAIPETVESGKVTTYGGLYRPNNNDAGRSDAKDEQSATFQIPYGIEVWGGYSEFTAEGKEQDVDKIFEEENRRPYAYKTVLSAKRQNYSELNDVYGYHVVTFQTKEQAGVTWDAQTVLDGLYLQDGRALSQAGTVEGEMNLNTVGGGAVVPNGAHIRNCVVTGNRAATYGGGLYVQPGGLVSGTLVYGNNAVDGAGIYANVTDEELEDQSAARPHIISSTIVRNGVSGENDAANLYFGKGTMVVNTAVWGSQTGVNVRGNEDIKFTDKDMLKLLTDQGASEEVTFYPFSNCYVEGSEALPGDYQNSTMTSTRETYFYKDENDYRLRAYSPLINNGTILASYNKMAEVFNLTNTDLRMEQGVSERRYMVDDNNSKHLQYKTRLDVGAFAHPGGAMPRNAGSGYYKKLYVASATYAPTGDENAEMDALGSTSATPAHDLNQLFDYIKYVRESHSDEEFEIFMDGGIYTPREFSDRKDDEWTRTATFSIPDGVKIYGGFNFAELKSENDYNQQTDAQTALAARERTDANTNSIIEPWEFANETILSGEANTSDEVKNVYHVLTASAGEGTMAKGITLNGVSVRYGQAAGNASVGDATTQGGGLHTEGVPFTILNSSFLENKAGRGGAIYASGDAAKVVLSGVNLSGNTAMEIAGNSTGYGGAVYLAGDAELEAYNTLWANNEAGGGAAIALYNGKPSVYLVNNTLARNKANGEGGATLKPLIAGHTLTENNTEIKVYNSILWGNEVDNLFPADGTIQLDVKYSGSDTEAFKTLVGEGANKNILLNAVNNTLTGPYFGSPTEQAGAAGYMPGADWGLRTLSAVVDAGNTDVYKLKDETEGITLPTDEYMQYADKEKSYMKRVDFPSESTDANRSKWIDMGVYEYQYTGLAAADVLYVVEQEGSGKNNDGSTWETATSNLQGAIHQLLNGRGKRQEDTGSQDVAQRHTRLYIASGNYRPVNNIEGNGFLVVKQDPDVEGRDYNTVTLTIYGSRDPKGDPNVPQMGTAEGQTVLHPAFSGQQQIMTVAQNTKGTTGSSPVSIILSDLVFDGELSETEKVPSALSTRKNNPTEGTAWNTVDPIYVNNCMFRNAKAAAVVLNDEDAATGSLPDRKVINSLFYNNNVGLQGQAQVVNATFANNTGLGAQLNGTSSIANSVFWLNNNSKEQFTGATPENSRWTGATDKNALGNDNEDLMTGPKFSDWANGDYSLKPGMKLLNQGNNEAYTGVMKNISDWTNKTQTEDGVAIANPHEFIKDYDLASAKRIGLVKDDKEGTIDIGAYEYNGMLNQVLYVDNKSSMLNTTGQSWQSPLRDVQEALDLAAVAANTEGAQKVGYVFVKGTDTSYGDIRLRVGTQMYGSMRGTEVAGTEGTDQEKVLSIINQRPGLLEVSTENRTKVSRVVSDEISGDYGIVDGVEVTNGNATEVTEPVVALKGNSMLRNALIWNNRTSTNTDLVNLGENSILYNALVRKNTPNTIDGTGYVVNATLVNGTLGGSLKKLNNLEVTDNSPFTLVPIKDENLSFQLSDKATALGAGISIPGDWDETVSALIYAAGDRDLLGNNRVFKGKTGADEGQGVDLGCFETWNIAGGSTSYAVTNEDNNYPHGKSVVYVGEGTELQLAQKDYTSEMFRPAHVLLKHGAGLWAGKFGEKQNMISLDNVSVERKVAAGGYDMVSVPFAANVTLPEGVTRYTYNGARRAEENLLTSKDAEKNYWEKVENTDAKTTPMLGYLLENTNTGSDDAIVRFDAMGTENAGTDPQPVYTEDASTERTVALKQHNSNKFVNGAFTHKENMGWNLFGTPYLHAVNYADMENGHVLYRLSGNGSFVNKQTWENGTGEAVGGHIPANAAVFTQTATLEAEEQLTINPREGELTEETSASRLAVYVAASAEAESDRVTVKAVAANEASEEYTLGSDAVKWMALNKAVPQIYAQRGNGSYALLSAVNKETDTPLGVYVAKAGQYELGIPADCNADEYETVVLKDATTGRAVDLKEGAYAFNTAQGGKLEGRFTLSFNRVGGGASGIRIYAAEAGTVVVEGLQPGYRIRIYDTEGRQQTTRVAQHARETLRGVSGHVTLVEVTGGGETLKTAKLLVK